MGSSGRLCKQVCLETALKGISGGAGESCIKRQNIPDCECEVAEGSFAKFSNGGQSRRSWLIVECGWGYNSS